MLRTPHIAAALLLLTASACGSEETQTVEVPDTAQREVSKPAPRTPGTYDRDGTLRPLDEKVMGSPLPAESFAVDTGGKWGAYQNRHSHADMVRFYKKNLGSRYTFTKHRGGTKLSPKSGKGPEIYIPLPPNPGDPTRVYYFGRDKNGDAPPLIDPPASARRPGSNTPPGQRTPGPGNAGRSNTPGGDDGGNYDTEIQERPDGTTVKIMRPKADGGSGNNTGRVRRTSSRNPARTPAEKTAARRSLDPEVRASHPNYVGTRKIETPKGTQY